jgi:hypothetical protein
MPDKPGQRYWRALEPFWTSVNIYGSAAQFREGFYQLQPQIGVLFAAHWLHSEVCNGGFHQFFFNPTGVLAPEAHAAFCALQLSDVVPIIEEAITFFGFPYPREREERCVILDTVTGDTREQWDPFFALDPLFYAALPWETHRFQLAADAYAESTVA